MIKIQTLPEIDIMSKKYRVEFENTDKDLESFVEEIKEIGESETPREKKEEIVEKIKMLTDVLLYEGAFDDIFKELKNIGIAGYIQFLNDLVLEVADIYNKQGKQFEKMQNIIKKNNEFKESKK